MISRLMIDQIRSLRNSGFPIKKIAQSLGVSRNTVRRYIRQNNQRDKKEAEPVAPIKNDRPSAWQEGLDSEKLVKERRSGVSAQQLYKEHEPAISYSRFCRVLREKSAPPPKPAIPLGHVAGQRAQVDYADGIKIVDSATGATKKFQLFCGVLPFSSLTFAEFAPSQKLDSFIRSHERMWAYFGGVTPYLVVDNLKSGVKKAHRYDPEVNATYCDYAIKTGFAVLPARPITPRDKAAVEAAIGVIQRSFFQRHRHTKFYSLAEANSALRAFIDQLNYEVMKDYGISRRDRFANEQHLLNPLPKAIYEMSEWKKAKIHPDCCIQSAKALYSVPFRYIGQTVRVKITAKIVEIFDGDLNSIACHHRQEIHGTSIVDGYLPPSQMQSGSFEVKQARAKAEAIGPNISALIELLLAGDRPLRYLRRIQGIIRLYEQGLSRESLEYAAAQAITFKRYQLAYIKSCASHHSELGSRPLGSAAPIRVSSTIHLHGDS